MFFFRYTKLDQANDESDRPISLFQCFIVTLFISVRLCEMQCGSVLFNALTSYEYVELCATSFLRAKFMFLDAPGQAEC